MGSTPHVAAPNHTKVSPLLTLSLEIKTRIMRHLPTSRDLAFLALTHRALKDPAERLTYQKIGLYFHSRRVTQCLRTLSQSPAKCALVESFAYMAEEYECAACWCRPWKGIADPHLLHVSMALERMSRLRHLCISTAGKRCVEWGGSVIPTTVGPRIRIGEILREGHFRLLTLCADMKFIDDDVLLKQRSLQAISVFVAGDDEAELLRVNTDKRLASKPDTDSATSSTACNPAIVSLQPKHILNVLLPTLGSMPLSRLNSIFQPQWVEYTEARRYPHKWRVHVAQNPAPKFLRKLSRRVRKEYPKDYLLVPYYGDTGIGLTPETKASFRSSPTPKLQLELHCNGEEIDLDGTPKPKAQTDGTQSE